MSNQEDKKEIFNALLELENSRSKKKKITISILFLVLFIVAIIGIKYGINNLYNESTTNPTGFITSPKAGSSTDKEITVTAETKNIGEGTYIWLAVDKPKIGLCWPKKHLPGNTKFSTTILEEGPKEQFTISIYVLNENFHKQWSEWKKREIFGGVHIPPESKRLASTNLILGG